MSTKILVFESYSETLVSLKNNTLFAVDTSLGQVCLVKTEATLKFFKNACPHLGVPFTQSGVCTVFGEVACKEHGHRYSVADGQECEGRKERLRFINYEIQDDQLYLIFE